TVTDRTAENTSLVGLTGCEDAYGVGAIVFEKLGVWWRVPTVATYVLGLAALIAAGRRGVLAARGRRLTWRTCLAVPLDRAG
nr:hypothetical protein [Streptococcus anginosus]